MGVDFYPCSNCGETYCDCGYYVTCECGRDWCSDECANEDGYSKCSCKLGKELEEDEEYCEDGCEKYRDDTDSCSSVSCEHLEYTSCKYCRKEDYSDEYLLCWALEILGKTREELIEIINNKNK